MKRISLFVMAAVAMISCSKTYEAKQVSLTSMNDSVNYALGLVNGAQMKAYQLRDDSSEATVTEFIEALERGYAGKVEELDEAASVGRNIGYAVKSFETKGLVENSAWPINEKVFFAGLVGGIKGDTTLMTAQVARDYFQMQYAASRMDTTGTDAKTVKAKCSFKASVVALNSKMDSINYAFGIMNGSEIKLYVLAQDTTGEDTKAFVAELNKALKSKITNPQIVNMGEQIGKNIKEQEPAGLIGEPTLTTDFDLIKQGFINGLKNYEEQMTGDEAGRYIQTTLASIKYGDTKGQGEQFLAENKLREGVQTTESGLQYEVIKMGKGPKPTAESTVKVHYHGTLIDGTVFDSSVDRGEPISFALNQVIPGWTEGVQLMPVGSKFRFFIPQELAYGAREAGSIPPYSALIFEVELLAIEK